MALKSNFMPFFLFFICAYHSVWFFYDKAQSTVIYFIHLLTDSFYFSNVPRGTFYQLRSRSFNKVSTWNISPETNPAFSYSEIVPRGMIVYEFFCKRSMGFVPCGTIDINEERLAAITFVPHGTRKIVRWNIHRLRGHVCLFHVEQTRMKDISKYSLNPYCSTWNRFFGPWFC